MKKNGNLDKLLLKWWTSYFCELLKDHWKIFETKNFIEILEKYVSKDFVLLFLPLICNVYI